MIVLVGESASGKSSIEKCLVEDYEYRRIISYTTRPPRKEDGEIDGVHYHFISTDEFIKLNNQGFFAETTTYRGWYYGSAKDDCTDDKVCVMNPHGLRQLLKNKDLNIKSFYINVPRRDRLIKILQRGDDIEEAYRRSVSDEGQFTGIEDEVNFVINNDGYKKSITDMANEVHMKTWY